MLVWRVKVVFESNAITKFVHGGAVHKGAVEDVVVVVHENDNTILFFHVIEYTSRRRLWADVVCDRTKNENGLFTPLRDLATETCASAK